MADLTGFEKGLLPSRYTVKRGAWLFISIVIIALLAVNFALKFYTSHYLNEATKLKKEIESKTAFFMQNLSQAEAVNFYSKAVNLKQLFDQHIYASKLIAAIEQSTHPFVFLKKLDVDAENNKAILSGQAQSSKVLAEQMVLWRSSAFFADPQLSSVNINENGSVSFAASFILRQKF